MPSLHCQIEQVPYLPLAHQLTNNESKQYAQISIRTHFSKLMATPLHIICFLD